MTRFTALTLALTLGLASAQTTAPAPATPAAPVTATPIITDVPAGHWAREAIILLVQKGVILGYPDGTFRGQGTLTRYEAAQIFARLLQTGVLQSPTVQQTLTQADLDLITKAISDLAAQIVTIDNRLKDVIADLDNVKARLATTEQTLQQVVTVAATHTEVQASADKVRAETQAALATKADVATTAALDARIKALEAERDAALAAAAKAKADADAAAAAAIVAKGEVVTPGSQPQATFTVGDRPKTSVGGGIGKDLNLGGIDYQLQIERADLLFGTGLRLNASFNPTARAYGADLHAVKSFYTNTGFNPYVGFGGGFTVSPSWVDAAIAATDLYFGALGGVSYDFTDTMQLYAELNGRYYLSGNGTATGQQDKNALGLRVNVGARLMF
ncbi:S-layer homology domain-containing protein [Deinococcus ficus]|uniref:SLH domain-containing protein n=1 Tax=Deinococcus ficus TaxID=317577 RepID=A0A221T2X2_9DEIO|nr:S-layer homology domain-containing protein [Deinococcus ficus]ASN83245.1 hypothetical protein DFI_18785 [Deinococcus ficus]